MSSIRDAAAEEVTAAFLPEPGAVVAPGAQAPAPVAAEIRRRLAEPGMTGTGSIVNLGSAAQGELPAISRALLAGARTRDAGPAGDSLRAIVTAIRGFAVSAPDRRRKRSWWERLAGRTAPFATFRARFGKVQGQVGRIAGDLLGHQHGLPKDIKSLDVLYEKTLKFCDEPALAAAPGAGA